MKEYYYKQGLMIGKCNDENKTIIEQLFEKDIRFNKKFAWISKRKFQLYKNVYILLAILLLPTYLILYLLNRITKTMLDAYSKLINNLP